jgi:tRNA modification GTPase
VVSLSAKERAGLDKLEDMIEQMIFSDQAHLSIDVCIDNSRQIECLMAAKGNLAAARTAIADRMPMDCIAIDLRSAVLALGQITGETVSDEVVREIFAKFCLGK